MGEDAKSPRVSRLKKRRRPRELNRDNDGVCALQLQRPQPAYSKQNRHTGGGGDAARIAIRIDEGKRKGNKLNCLSPGLGGRVYAGETGEGCGAAVKVTTPVLNALRHPSLQERPPCVRQKSNFVEDKKTLSFIDDMDQYVLLDAIPSIAGFDIALYNEGDLGRLIEDAMKISDSDGYDNNLHAINGVYHCLAGRLDPHQIRGTVTDEQSIAFPRCKKTRSAATPSYRRICVFQRSKLIRKTEHGMLLPSSWYRFPRHTVESSRKPHDEQKSSPPRLTSNNADGGDADPTKKDEGNVEVLQEGANVLFPQIFGNRSSLDHNHEEEETAEKPPLLYRNDDNQFPRRNTVDQLPPPKYEGMVRIESKKGATIREVCNIDESNYVIGKLCKGDERYYLEKEILQPLPISSSLDSEEDEAECVSVVRYKIVLKPEDCDPNSFAAVESGQMVGWISDRGRLADDTYLILKEV